MGLKIPKVITELKISGQRLLLRLDLNVPLSTPNHEPAIIQDDTRIEESLPTLHYALEQGARVIVLSHLGRPAGRPAPQWSMEPVAARLAERLGREVMLADDCVGDGVELLVQRLKNAQVLVLENLRFHAEEEAPTRHFGQRLARLGQIYVNDAFGTMHRRHTSITGVPSIMAERGVGLLVAKELRFLAPLLQSPPAPFIMILGGMKVTDKLPLLRSILKRVDGLLIGGAMSHAFWVARNQVLPPGAYIPADSEVLAAQSILREAQKQDVDLILPVDLIEGQDVGPQSVEQFRRVLDHARTVFWNGPLGRIEVEAYQGASRAVAHHLASLQDPTLIVGGGHTVGFIKNEGLADRFDHLSTGGGATLAYLEGRSLPGLEALESGPSSIPIPWQDDAPTPKPTALGQIITLSRSKGD